MPNWLSAETSVAVELCTNAVRHTVSGQGSFAVEVTWTAQMVRVAVFDSGAPDGPRVIEDPLREDGRGLLMVNTLSARKGVSGDARGRVVWVSLPNVSTCPATSGGQSPGILPGGSVERIAGVTSGPVQQSWAGPWACWHGPHASQAWPLTGAFPGVPPGALGDFVAVSGLSGHWARPVQEYVQVTPDDVPLSWSVDSAMPAASGPYPHLAGPGWPGTGGTRDPGSPSSAGRQPPSPSMTAW